MTNPEKVLFTVVDHIHGTTGIALIEYPGPEDWAAVYRRALVTVKKNPEDLFKPPSSDWIDAILEARHSPIRRAVYSFHIGNIPSNTSVHFCRHVHSQPYVSSLRNDRQEKIDGDAAPRSAPVDMILDVNAEELMVMANKRLCAQAAPVTRAIMQGMALLAGQATPEIKRHLVPMCEYHGGYCHEMHGCGHRPPFTVFR